MIYSAFSVTQIGSVAAARATPGAAGVVLALASGALVQLYVWAPTAIEPDDGAAWIAPGPGPGRWHAVATLDSGSKAEGAEVILAVAWDGSRAAVQLQNGWRVVGADAATLYIAARVLVSG